MIHQQEKDTALLLHQLLMSVTTQLDSGIPLLTKSRGENIVQVDTPGFYLANVKFPFVWTRKITVLQGSIVNKRFVLDSHTFADLFCGIFKFPIDCFKIGLDLYTFKLTYLVNDKESKIFKRIC